MEPLKPHPINVGDSELLLVRDEEMRHSYLEAHPEVPRELARVCFIGLFREPFLQDGTAFEHGTRDYLGVAEYDDDEEDSIKLYFREAIDPEGFLYWMGNAFTRQYQVEQGKRLNASSMGNFRARGWRPRVIIDDRPHPVEEEMYQGAHAVIIERKIQEGLSDLDAGVPEDWAA